MLGGGLRGTIGGLLLIHARGDYYGILYFHSFIEEYAMSGYPSPKQQSRWQEGEFEDKMLGNPPGTDKALFKEYSESDLFDEDDRDRVYVKALAILEADKQTEMDILTYVPPRSGRKRIREINDDKTAQRKARLAEKGQHIRRKTVTVPVDKVDEPGWYVKGKRYDTKGEAAESNDVSVRTIQRWCRGTSDKYPKREDCKVVYKDE